MRGACLLHGVYERDVSLPFGEVERRYAFGGSHVHTGAEDEAATKLPIFVYIPDGLAKLGRTGLDLRLGL